MRDLHERAGGLDHFQPQCAGAREGAFGRPVGRDHQRWSRDVVDMLRDGDALRFESAEDGWVVNQVAEDGERTGISVVERKGDRVAHPETHAQMRRPDDSHQAKYTYRAS